MADFRDLEVWKESRKLRNRIQEVVKEFPKEEKYRIVDQIIRSSRSVTANIAEGYGRYHYQENIQFCRQARGSLVETIDHLVTAQDCGYITEDSFNELELTYNQILKMLNGYILYLKKKKTENLI
jgi:four helix bundle protein